MKPDVQKVMMRSFEQMLTDIAPNITAEYAVGSASVIGLMMFQTATEFERGADIRVRENVALREIFSAAAGQVEDQALGSRLKAASEARDLSLRISDLDKANDELAALLIELQVYAELQKSGWARDLETRIWAELVRSAAARRLPHPMIDLMVDLASVE